MLVLKTVLWLAVFAGGAAFILLQQQTRAVYATSIAELERRLGEVPQIEKKHKRLIAEQPDATELQSLRQNRAELLRLRSEVLGGVSATAEPVAATERHPVTETGSVFNPKRVATTDLKLKHEWKNVGIATPSAAFETYCWAESGGDVDVLATTLLIDAASRAKAGEILARLADAERAKFGTADQFIAMLWVGSGTSFEGIKVLGEYERAPGEVVLRTLWQYGDGRVRENTNVVLRQTGAGWKRPLSPGHVERLFNLRMSGFVPGVRQPPPQAAADAKR